MSNQSPRNTAQNISTVTFQQAQHQPEQSQAFLEFQMFMSSLSKSNVTSSIDPSFESKLVIPPKDEHKVHEILQAPKPMCHPAQIPDPCVDRRSRKDRQSSPVKTPVVYSVYSNHEGLTQQDQNMCISLHAKKGFYPEASQTQRCSGNNSITIDTKYFQSDKPSLHQRQESGKQKSNGNLSYTSSQIHTIMNTARIQSSTPQHSSKQVLPSARAFTNISSASTNLMNISEPQQSNKKTQLIKPSSIVISDKSKFIRDSYQQLIKNQKYINNRDFTHHIQNQSNNYNLLGDWTSNTKIIKRTLNDSPNKSSTKLKYFQKLDCPPQLRGAQKNPYRRALSSNQFIGEVTQKDKIQEQYRSKSKPQLISNIATQFLNRSNKPKIDCLYSYRESIQKAKQESRVQIKKEITSKINNISLPKQKFSITPTISMNEPTISAAGAPAEKMGLFDLRKTCMIPFRKRCQSHLVSNLNPLSKIITHQASPQKKLPGGKRQTSDISYKREQAKNDVKAFSWLGFDPHSKNRERSVSKENKLIQEGIQIYQRQNVGQQSHLNRQQVNKLESHLYNEQKLSELSKKLHSNKMLFRNLNPIIKKSNQLCTSFKNPLSQTHYPASPSPLKFGKKQLSHLKLKPSPSNPTRNIVDIYTGRSKENVNFSKEMDILNKFKPVLRQQKHANNKSTLAQPFRI